MATGPRLARGEVVPYDDPDGWTLESTFHDITLSGDACAAYQDGASVSIAFPCD